VPITVLVDSTHESDHKHFIHGSQVAETDGSGYGLRLSCAKTASRVIGVGMWMQFNLCYTAFVFHEKTSKLLVSSIT